MQRITVTRTFAVPAELTPDRGARSADTVDLMVQWVHPPPATFPQQGWVRANGLTVAAPGLYEAEVTADGVPGDVVLSALKPPENGEGIVLRLLNPSDRRATAHLRIGLPIAHATPVRLDETAVGEPLSVAGASLAVDVPPHSLRSLLLT